MPRGRFGPEITDDISLDAATKATLSQIIEKADANTNEDHTDSFINETIMSLLKM